MAYEKRPIDVSVLKTFHERGEVSDRFGKQVIRLVVYNSKYCKLEKCQITEWEGDDGNLRTTTKSKGFSLEDLQIIEPHLEEIKQSMQKFEHSKTDSTFKGWND